MRSASRGRSPFYPPPPQLTEDTWRRVTPGSLLLGLPDGVQCSIAAALLTLASWRARLAGARALLSLRAASRQAASFGLGAVSDLQLQLALLQGQSRLVTEGMAEAEGRRKWDEPCRTWEMLHGQEPEVDPDAFVQGQLSRCRAVQSAAVRLRAHSPDQRPVRAGCEHLRMMESELECIKSDLVRQAMEQWDERGTAQLKHQLGMESSDQSC